VNNYIVVSEKLWHRVIYEKLREIFKEDNWFFINSSTEFNAENLIKINPNKIFIPHWSSIISKNIYENFECIVFHMTDLPYGRGGSPLQNLIVRGHRITKISAIRVAKGIDTGDIYSKKDLHLNGTAQEIFLKSCPIIQNMITEIITKNILPMPQKGQIVEFKRRSPDDGNISSIKEISMVYDYIRMLDCEGYPNAFIETDHLKIEFTGAQFSLDNNLIANVRISKKK
jgi:methionyl-tRNA formyltransferase